MALGLAVCGFLQLSLAARSGLVAGQLLADLTARCAHIVRPARRNGLADIIGSFRGC